MNLHSNIILITGGSRGIGLEFARQLLKRGNQVIITGRNPERLQEAQKALPGLHTFRSDVSHLSDIKALYKELSEQFPDLNILINNAGIGNRLDLQKQHGVDSLTEELRTNLQAPIQMINEFLPLLSKQNKSAIINITSALAFAPFPIVPLYSATKAGLHSYTISLRAQFKDTNIKVFEVAPPTTETEMLDSFAKGDLKNVKTMSATNLVAYSLSRVEKDQFEICPGQSAQLRLMGRLAPNFLLKSMSKPLRGLRNEAECSVIKHRDL